MKDEQPWCCRCWVSRYCSAFSDKCGWYADTHSCLTCPHRTLFQPTTTHPPSTSAQPSPPAPDTSKWKCPRCHESGWYGCAVCTTLLRCRPTCCCRTASLLTATTTTTTAATWRPPPPTDSPQVVALREAVANLTARFRVIAARFDTMEARLNSVTAQHATTERTFASLVESHHAVLATITAFSEKLEALSGRCDTNSDQHHKEPPRSTSQSSASSTSSCGAASTSSFPPASRRPKGKLR